MSGGYYGRGLVPANAVQLLFVLRNANMQLTTDQIFTKLFAGSLWTPFTKGVVAVCKSGAISGACAGGIYPAPAKAGTAIVAASASWAALTGVNLAAIFSGTAQIYTETPYLSLTTGNGAALIADFFIYGTVND